MVVMISGVLPGQAAALAGLGPWEWSDDTELACSVVFGGRGS